MYFYWEKKAYVQIFVLFLILQNLGSTWVYKAMHLNNTQNKKPASLNHTTCTVTKK